MRIFQLKTLISLKLLVIARRFSYLNAKRRSCRCKTINNISFFINQEFGEIPLYAVPKKSTFAGLQELVQWSRILTIHINLRKTHTP